MTPSKVMAGTNTSARSSADSAVPRIGTSIELDGLHFADRAGSDWEDEQFGQDYVPSRFSPQS